MKAYNGTFTKKNGDARTMRFIRMTDIPEKFIALQAVSYTHLRAHETDS